MDKHSKCSLYRLRMALAISIAFCFTTDIFAQATSTTDSTAITTPDTVGELVNGLNTVWMLLAAMRDFGARPEDCVMFGDKSSDEAAAKAAGIASAYAGEGGR